MQTGVPDKINTRQIEHFALVPICSSPYAGNRWDLGQLPFHVLLPPWQNHLEHQRVLLDRTGKVVDDFCVRLPFDLLCFFLVRFKIVDTRNAIKQVESEIAAVSEKRANVNQAVW